MKFLSVVLNAAAVTAVRFTPNQCPVFLEKEHCQARTNTHLPRTDNRPHHSDFNKVKASVRVCPETAAKMDEQARQYLESSEDFFVDVAPHSAISTTSWAMSFQGAKEKEHQDVYGRPKPFGLGGCYLKATTHDCSYEEGLGLTFTFACKETQEADIFTFCDGVLTPVVKAEATEL